MESEGDNNHSLLMCAELASFLFKKEGVLEPNKFVDFWATLRGASYISTLIMKYIIAMTGEEKHATLVDVVKRLSQGNLSSLPEVRQTELDPEGMLRGY